MQLRYIISGIAVLILGLAGCRQETNVPRSEIVPPDELSRTTGIQFPVRLEAAELGKQYVTLEAYVDGYPAPATMVGPEKYRYVFSWKRNGEPVTDATFAVGTYRSTVSQRMAASSTNDPFAKEVEEHFWELTVTDREQPGLSSTVVTSVTFTRDCGEYPGYVYVDCEAEEKFLFAASITEAVPGDAAAQESWLRRTLEHQILGPDGTSGHTRFRNFANWVLREGYSGNEVKESRIDPETYELIDGYAWSPPLLMDRTCIDIPLVGFVCLHGYAFDVHNEPGGNILDYGPAAASRNTILSSSAEPVSSATAAENGTIVLTRLDADSFDVSIVLNSVTLDLLFEPPADPSLFDIKNDGVNYRPEDDLSSYLKAYGTALLGKAYRFDFRVALPTSADDLRLVLRTASLPRSDFQFVFKKGPYCNNNLGTTETPLAGITHVKADGLRPFNALGAPMYAGLISDTISGYQQGGASDVLTSYYARQTYQAPLTDASNPHGGSGVGRDRIGAGAYPYAFDVEQGIYSDNPNNCARPADACSVAGVQDGGPEWQSSGPLGGCEYPNVSNNSDDATFKVSEQITSIIPFMQGELMNLVPLKGR